MTDTRLFADRYFIVGQHFSSIVAQVRDWDAPTPVPAWRAADIVDHLISWSREFIAYEGVPLRLPVTGDPATRWAAHHQEVDEVLRGPQADLMLNHPHLGRLTLASALDGIYTTDVLLHTWDLAQSAGVPDGLDPGECRALHAGMEPISEMMRSSGHYGPAVPVPPETDAATTLLAFLGRDPAWRSRIVAPN